MAPPEYYARSFGLDVSRWQTLEYHLKCVAAATDENAAAFDAAKVGHLAGLWHDLGKFSPQFQNMLKNVAASKPKARVDHSTAGALHAACSNSHYIFTALAYAIAGHHAGLADMGTLNSTDSGCLQRRITKPPPEAEAALANAPCEIKNVLLPPDPSFLTPSAIRANPFRFSMFARMLLSALVDADRSDAAAFPLGSSLSNSNANAITMTELLRRLNLHLAKFSLKPNSHALAIERAQLLAACRAASAWSPGLFSLTAPTGSGKTLSSMAFALAHAELNNLRRVIYVLPFTTIIEQNAAVFRDVLDSCSDGIVVEHHSAIGVSHAPTDAPAFDSQFVDESPNEISPRHQAAVENWDAPFIVTTNVQLLESLFASSAAKCRKLHRIARSIIIFDEAQQLPVNFLRPTLTAIKELTDRYGCTMVFSSATMPAIKHDPERFDIGLANIREIVPDPPAMSRALRRAQVSLMGQLDDE